MPPGHRVARPRQSRTARRGLQAGVRRAIRGLSAASRDPARSNHPSSTRGNLGHGRRENPQGTAIAPARSAHRSGGKCRRYRSIFSPFYPSGCSANGEKEFPAVIFVHADGIPIPPGHTPRSGVLRQRELHFYRLLSWVPIVLAALSSINRAVFRRFHRHSPRDFAKGLKSAIVARRNRLFTCNSETV